MTTDDIFSDVETYLKSNKSLFTDADGLIEDLISLWRKHHTQGVRPYDFAHILLSLSADVMLQMESMDSALAFGRFTVETGESMERCIRSNWPPPDPDQWQWDWRKKSDDAS